MVAFDIATPLSWTLSWLQLTVPRIVPYKPVFGYYLGKKTLVEAKKLGDVPESGASSRLATEFPRDVVRR
jgi:hypothetical protein